MSPRRGKRGLAPSRVSGEVPVPSFARRAVAAPAPQPNPKSKIQNPKSLAVLALLLLAGCAARQAQRPPVSYATQDWTFGDAHGRKLTTPHYEIYTTLRDDVLVQSLPDFIEAALERYQQLVPPARCPAALMPVYVFASRGQWLEFTRQFTGPRYQIYVHVRNGGYTERGVVVMEYVAHSTTFPILAHEGFHQYLHYYVGDSAPAWLNEGLATLSEGQRWDGMRLASFDPAFNPRRRNDLAEAVVRNQLHALPKLLQTNAGEIITGSDRSVATYYAQLWALMLFLQEGAGAKGAKSAPASDYASAGNHAFGGRHTPGGKYALGFRKLLDSLGQPGLEQHAKAAYIWSDEQTYDYGTALFRSFISEDVAAVEREYVEYIRALPFAKR